MDAKLKNIVDLLEGAYPGYEIIYLADSGSVLHGTSSENSDRDIKGLFVPSLESVILKCDETVIEYKTNVETANSADDIDVELFSVEEFIRLLGRGEAGAIDILFSMFAEEFVIRETDKSKLIRDNYKSFLVNKTQAFVGFALKQASLYSAKGIRLQELEDIISFLEGKVNDLSKTQRKKIKLKEFRADLQEFISDKTYIFEEAREEGDYLNVLTRLLSYENPIEFVMKTLIGVRKTYGARAEKAKVEKGKDLKALAHALRAIEEAIELQETGFIKFPLSKAEDLKMIKFGKIQDREEISNIIEERMTYLQYLEKKSSLPLFIDNHKADLIKVEMFTDKKLVKSLT
jgi:predicted nucleotidyltransferase